MVIKYNQGKSSFASADAKQTAATAIGAALPDDKKTQRLLNQGKVGQAQKRLDNYNSAQDYMTAAGEGNGGGVQSFIDKGKFGKAANLASAFNTGNSSAQTGNSVAQNPGANFAPGMPSIADQSNTPPSGYVDADKNGYDDRSNDGLGNKKQSDVNSTNTFQDTNINNQGSQGGQVTNIGIDQQGQGVAQVDQSSKGIQDAIDQLKGLGSQFSGALGSLQNSRAYGQTDDASNQAFDYLKQAMGANVDQGFLQDNRGFYGDNEQMIRQQYSPGGIYGKDTNKDANIEAANMAERGLFSSSSSDSAQAALAADLKDRETAAILANRQAGRGEINDERGRISQTGLGAGSVASGLGNIYSDLASKSGDQDNALRSLIMQAGGNSGSLAQGLGNLGINLADLGIKNTGMGMEAQDKAIQNYLSSLGLEAQIKMAEEILKNQFRQQGMVNVQGAKQNTQNDRYISEIMPQIMG